MACWMYGVVVAACFGSSDARLAETIAAQEANHERFSSIAVDGVVRVGRVAEGGSEAPENRDEEVVEWREADFQYVRRGEWERYEFKWRGESDSVLGDSRIVVANGERWFVHHTDTGQSSINTQRNPLASLHPFRPLDHGVLGFDGNRRLPRLAEYVDQGTFRIEESGDDELDGVPCRKFVFLDVESGYSFSVWVAPQYGHVEVRREARNAQGEIRLLYKAIDVVRDRGGGYLPNDVYVSHLLPDGSAFIRRWTAANWRTNVRPSQFEVALPANTVVADGIGGFGWTVGDPRLPRRFQFIDYDSQTYMMALRTAPPTPRAGLAYRAAAGVLLLGVLLAAAWLVVRRRR